MKNSFLNSIRIKMTLLVFLALSATMSSGLFIVMERDLNHIENELIENAHIYSGFLTQDLISIIYMGSTDRAADVTAKLRSIPQIVSMIVYDNNQLPVFRFSTNNTSPLHSSSELHQQLTSDKTLSVQHPLEYQGTDYGNISIQMSRFQINQARSEYLLQAFILGLLLILSSVLLALLIERFFSRPIMQLLSALKHITKTHDYAFRLPVQRSDEMGTLFEGFNQLQEQLQVTHKELLGQKYALDQASIVSITDPTGTISYVNDYFCSISGYQKEEIIGRPHEYVDSSDLPYNVLDEIAETITKGEIWRGELKNRSKQGAIWWVYTTIIPLFDNHNTITQYLAVSFDISERKKAEGELTKLSLAVESSSSAIVITDFDGTIEYINPKFTEITGYSKQESIGKSSRILNSGESPKSLYTELWNTIKSGDEWRGIFHNINKAGQLYWERDSISGVKDNHGNITHFIAIKDDITYEYELEEKLNYQATHDGLTGLINRHEFEVRVKNLLPTLHDDNPAQHAMCFMDLDQFKIINDSCGHIAGDELLRQLAKLLQQTVRQTDTLARLGGDEFGLLMTHCSLEQAHRVATTVLEKIQNFQFFWEDQSFRIGSSIGLVAITQTTQTLDELLKQADAACYMAKDLGRNRIHVYRMEDTEMAQRHGEMQWVVRINNALSDNRFCLYAQPIVSLDNSHKKHYELLIRMIDETGKIVPPGAFLPAAERYNLIQTIDFWVIKKAFSLLAEHPRFVADIHFISINLSGPSLTDENVLDFIISNLTELKIDFGKICFEITETVAISNLNTATSFINTLKKMGCHFALDDFGSGLSSFGYLKNLPVDYLKIDGMFVKDMANDPINHAIVKSINKIGQVMGMKTIAEFVENEKTKQILKTIGINYAQGFGLGKPEPFEAIIKQSKRKE